MCSEYLSFFAEISCFITLHSFFTTSVLNVDFVSISESKSRYEGNSFVMILPEKDISRGLVCAFVWIKSKYFSVTSSSLNLSVPPNTICSQKWARPGIVFSLVPPSNLTSNIVDLDTLFLTYLSTPPLGYLYSINLSFID